MPLKPPASAKFDYLELSGRLIEVPGVDRATRTFLDRASELAHDDAVSPEEVRAFVFGPENPILARHPTLPGAYPDAATVRNPLYWVCVDLVLRAEARAANYRSSARQHRSRHPCLKPRANSGAIHTPC